MIGKKGECEMQYAVLAVCALFCLILYPVFMGHMVKKIIEKKSFMLEGIVLAIFGGCIWYWLVYVFGRL